MNAQSQGNHECPPEVIQRNTCSSPGNSVQLALLRPSLLVCTDAVWTDQGPFVHLTCLRCWKAKFSRKGKAGALLSMELLRFSSESRVRQMVAEKNLKTSVLRDKSHDFK